MKFEKETVWLSQAQIAELFLRNRSVITKHINNIFKEQELKEELVSANFAHTTRHGAIEGKTQEKIITYFNLDVIISVGYRVNSKRGTQFRQWATQRLKEHLIQGYSVNQQRLQQLQQTIQLIHQTGNTHQLNITEAKGLLDIITHYTRSFVLLNQFDSNKLTEEELNKNITYQLNIMMPSVQ